MPSSSSSSSFPRWVYSLSSWQRRTCRLVFMVSCDPVPPPQCSWFSSREREREQNKKASKSNSSHGSSITVIYCDCVWAGLSRVDSEKEEGIVDTIVRINLDSLILVMTARKQLHLSQRAIWLTPIITIHNKRPGRTAAVVSISCQASNQHWHPAGSAGQ